MKVESFETSQTAEFGDLLSGRAKDKELKVGFLAGAYFEYYRMWGEGYDQQIHGRHGAGGRQPAQALQERGLSRPVRHDGQVRPGRRDLQARGSGRGRALPGHLLPRLHAAGGARPRERRGPDPLLDPVRAHHPPGHRLSPGDPRQRHDRPRAADRGAEEDGLVQRTTGRWWAGWTIRRHTTRSRSTPMPPSPTRTCSTRTSASWATSSAACTTSSTTRPRSRGSSAPTASTSR